MHNDHHRTPSHLSLEFNICNNQHKFKVTIMNKALYFNIALWRVIYPFQNSFNCRKHFFFNFSCLILTCILMLYLYYNIHTQTIILHILGIQSDMQSDISCYNVDASTTLSLRPFHIVLHNLSINMEQKLIGIMVALIGGTMILFCSKVSLLKACKLLKSKVYFGVDVN